jgi:hypothetical protein
VRREIVFGEIVFAFPTSAVNDWKSVSLGVPAHPTAETTCHAHEISVVKMLV